MIRTTLGRVADSAEKAFVSGVCGKATARVEMVSAANRCSKRRGNSRRQPVRVAVRHWYMMIPLNHCSAVPASGLPVAVLCATSIYGCAKKDQRTGVNRFAPGSKDLNTALASVSRYLNKASIPGERLPISSPNQNSDHGKSRTVFQSAGQDDWVRMASTIMVATAFPGWADHLPLPLLL